MATESYLQHLQAQLAEGSRNISSDRRARHVSYLRSRQNEDGGFSGRLGPSDLYYTGFALRGLSILDELSQESVCRAVPFLRASLTRPASVIDFFSLLYACLLVQIHGGPDLFADSPASWPERVAAMLGTFRTPDGGYAKTPGSKTGSTYHTFLVGLTFELLGRSFPEPDEVARFILARRREDGGFVEIAPMRKSGTNPTAAGVGVLQMLEMATESSFLTAEIRAGVVRLLTGLPSSEGGLRANGRIPLADLLSTFTGLWTLRQLGAVDQVDRQAARRYIEALDMPVGGFRGGLWDDQADVEYTFYGLGALAVLA